MKISNRFEFTLTSSLMAAFSVGTPWLWFAGYQWVAFTLGAVCVCASALVFTLGYEAFGR